MLPFALDADIRACLVKCGVWEDRAVGAADEDREVWLVVFDGGDEVFCLLECRA